MPGSLKKKLLGEGHFMSNSNSINHECWNLAAQEATLQAKLLAVCCILKQTVIVLSEIAPS